jgi:hypothetical protein
LAGFGLKNEIPGSEQVQESGGGAGIQIGITEGGLKEALEARELL